MYDNEVLLKEGWVSALKYEDEITDDLKKRTGGKVRLCCQRSALCCSLTVAAEPAIALVVVVVGIAKALPALAALPGSICGVWQGVDLALLPTVGSVKRAFMHAC